MSELVSSKVSPPIPLSGIEAELTRQLSAARDPSGEPVHRSRMSNLVIYCDRPETCAAMGTTVPRIVVQHPARVILVVREADDGDGQVLGTVNTWRHEGGGREPHICSEQITLRAGSAGMEHLPYAVCGLLLGDLPTNLWWNSAVPPPFAGNLLYELAGRAQQIIYDSIGWAEPARAVAATSAWLAGVERGRHDGAWQVASDVNWRRLKYWRRILAQALDPNSALGALESITKVTLEHGPHAVVQAWEIVSWLASRLGWQVDGGKIEPGVQISWKVRAPHGRLAVHIHRLTDGPSELRRIRIACSLSGRSGAINLVDEGQGMLKVELEGQDLAARTVILPPTSLHDLLVRQLTDRERDPVFLDSMAVAKQFAQTVVG